MTTGKTVQFLVFRLDERNYGIRVAQAQRVVRAVDCTPLPQTLQVVLGVIDVQGEIVPVFNIRRRFNLIERDIGPDDHFIIARISTRTVALVVDSVIGLIERSEDEVIAMEKVLPHVERIEGVVALEDGLVLIHDLNHFLSAEEEQSLEQALTEQPRHGS